MKLKAQDEIDDEDDLLVKKTSNQTHLKLDFDDNNEEPSSEEEISNEESQKLYK